MKALCNKITQHKCQEHEDDYAFLCIEKDCKHKQRMMCAQCIPINTNGLINIKKAFKFFESQEINQVGYQCKSNLWQQFKRSKYQLIEQINELESQMETLIESIKGNDIVKRIESYCFDREITNNDIQSLGSELIGGIIIDSNGNYRLPNDNFPQQDGYIKSMEILQTCENMIKLITQQVNSIINMEQYQTSETIQLTAQCGWLCFNHNQTQLAAAVYSSIIIYKQSECGQWIEYQQLINGHTSWIRQVKFNHNSTQLASCSFDKLIIIWNKKPNGKWIIHNKLDQHSYVNSICYNHNSTILASGIEDNRINIYVCSDNNWILKQQLNEDTFLTKDVCFNHNSKLLASGNFNNSIILWECNSVGKWIVKQKLIEHTKTVFRVSFNSNSTQLLSGSWDNSIKIWSVDNSIWKCSHTLTGHIGDINSVYFNSQSNMIISSSEDASIKLWRINKQNNWECSQTINVHKDYVYCAILSSDCSMIISGARDKMIKIHRLNKQSQQQQQQQFQPLTQLQQQSQQSDPSCILF